MSNVNYDPGSLVITLDGLETVANALGDVKKKTPAAAKVAINATARQAKRLMIAEAKARYAVNAAGQKHLKELTQRKKATNSNLSAELYISSFRNDLGYFETQPNKPYMGKNVKNAPAHFRGHVLKSRPMIPLTGQGNLSKGFLVEFKNGHIGMVQRVIGSKSRNTVTYRSGVPRWKNALGNVEKLRTMGSPSATSMHNTIWPIVEPSVEAYLQQRLRQQVERILERERKK